MRIGIFGGTFNPPHKGHEMLAEKAAGKFGLDRVIIIPSCIPPHKMAGSLVSGEDRLNMCRLAFSGPLYEVSDIEIRRGNKSYTVDTLRQLKSEHPDDELFFIMGSDMFSTFNKWYKWEEILSLATVVGASRKKGYEPDFSAYTPEQRERMLYLETEPFEISSTKVRGLIKSNCNTDKYVNPEVVSYIKDNSLYDDEFDSYRLVMRQVLDDYRLYHCECVSESAENLAKQYGADTGKAKLAGLLHDITKNLPRDEQLRLMGDITPLERTNHKVWHQISAPVYLEENDLCHDPEILEAVRWHTTGKAGMTLLSKVIYVADFISADREYEDVETVRRLASVSLEHAILYTSRYTINSLVGTDHPVHPSTMECYNDMLMHFGL